VCECSACLVPKRMWFLSLASLQAPSNRAHRIHKPCMLVFERPPLDVYRSAAQQYPPSVLMRDPGRVRCDAIQWEITVLVKHGTAGGKCWFFERVSLTPHRLFGCMLLYFDTPRFHI
jgi:hypothetical protein